MVADIFIRECEINEPGIGGYGVSKLRVMPDGAAVAAVDLENMDKIEIIVRICIVDI